jgi:hypothetical protein
VTTFTSPFYNSKQKQTRHVFLNTFFKQDKVWNGMETNQIESKENKSNQGKIQECLYLGS